MLVLTRKIGECITIGEDISIKIVDVRGSRVRMGISAPEHIGVHRQEVRNAIMRRSTTHQRNARSGPAGGDG